MRITGLTVAGEGLAEDGSRWPRTLPGEEIDPEGRILTPSPDRVSAPCRHYKSCGGCAMQHAADGFVASWKRDVVARALAARGISAEIETVLTSPPASRRRAKFSGRRTKKGAIVGFHGRASQNISAVDDCRVVTEAIRQSLPVLLDITRHVASRQSEIDLMVTDSPEGLDVVVTGAPALDHEGELALTELAQKRGLARLTVGAETIVTLAPPSQSLGPARVVPPPGAFLQATRHGEQALTQAVQAHLGQAARIVDLFAGAGTFTLPLAKTAEVHAVEGAADLLEALDHGWRFGTGLRRVTTEVRDLFRRPLLPDELRYDAAVIDPPRAGAEAQVAEICRSDLPRLAMVSCNPVTFARDAQQLVSAGYTLGPITVVDQFRWSAHVELCAPFTRT